MTPHLRTGVAVAVLATVTVAGCASSASSADGPYAAFRPATPSVTPPRPAHPSTTPRRTPPGAAAAPSITPVEPSTAADAARPPALAALTSATREAILVTGSPTDVTRATVTIWTRTAAGWTSAGPATEAHVGVNGIAAAATRRQGDGTTPDGTYPIVGTFGLGPPSTAMPYTRITDRLYWVYDPNDPATYNSFQTATQDTAWSQDADWSEHMVSHGQQYLYGAVIGFNGAGRRGGEVDTTRGGGIFLHVDDGTPTAGCISVPAPDVARILAWLDPGAHPQIVIRGS